MMLAKRTLIAGVAIIAVLAVVRSRASHSAVSTESAQEAETETVSQILTSSHSQTATPTLSKSQLAASLKLSPAMTQASRAEQERQSIQTLSSILSDESSLSASPATLVKRLMQDGYEPVASRDADPSTGSMIVIQTKNTLPGSRYFRAQFFSDSEGNYTPQHISFELRPGTSPAVVKASLQKAFGPLPSPHYQDKEWTTYKLANGYTLWTKILNAEDVKEKRDQRSRPIRYRHHFRSLSKKTCQATKTKCELIGAS